MNDGSSEILGVPSFIVPSTLGAYHGTSGGQYAILRCRHRSHRSQLLTKAVRACTIRDIQGFPQQLSMASTIARLRTTFCGAIFLQACCTNILIIALLDPCSIALLPKISSEPLHRGKKGSVRFASQGLIPVHAHWSPGSEVQWRSLSLSLD